MGWFRRGADAPIQLNLTERAMGGSETRDAAFDLNSPQARAFFTGMDLIDGARIIGTETAWRESEWLRLCLEANAKNIAKLNFEVSSAKGTKPLAKHPILDLMETPNPWFSTNELIQTTVIMLGLYGECFWLLSERNGELGFPTRTEFLNPRMVHAVLDAKKFNLLGWKVTLPDGTQPTIDPLDVIHFKIPNPFNRWRGAAPLEAVRISVSADLMAQKFNLGFFQRGAVPAGVLTTEKPMSPTQASDVLAKFESRHRDSHRPALLHSGMTYQETQATQRDMEFEKGRLSNRAGIMATYGVPPVEVGLETANFATAREQRRAYWESRLIPLAALIADTIDRRIIRDPKLRSRFNTDTIPELKDALKDKMTVAVQMLDHGVPWNIVDQKLEIGIGPIPGGDTGFISYTMTPMEIAADPPEPAPPTTPPGSGDNTDENGDQTASPAEGDDKNADGGKGKGKDKGGKDGAEKKSQDVWSRIEAHVARALTEGQPKARGLSADDKKAIDALLEKSKKQVAELAERYYKQAAGVGISQAAELLDITFDMDNPKISDIIKEKLIQITGIEDTTKEKIRKLIEDGLNDGSTVDEIADALREDYNFGPDRARMIARTETASTVNAARTAVLEEEGVEFHEWVSAQDERVRDDHADEDGNIVALGEEFPVTELEYPGEPGGDPEQVINCRCVTLPADSDSQKAFNARLRCECKREDEAGQRAPHTDGCARAEFWQRTVKGYAEVERRFASALSKHFFKQRKAILKIILG
jgi:HK97 family phage portal protein